MASEANIPIQQGPAGNQEQDSDQRHEGGCGCCGDHGATTEAAWASEACTLPTEEQPLREAEFDALFRAGLHRVDRPESTRLELTLDRAYEQTARELTAKESGCCSFFTFDCIPDGGTLRMDIEVPEPYVPVLDALAERAANAGRR